MKKVKSSRSGFPGRDKWLSMDEYIKFVNFNARYFRKDKASKAEKLAMRVDVPFSIG